MLARAMGLFRRSAVDRVVTLPPRGRALIVSDLHGHAGDWEEFLYASRAVERLEQGEDLWVLITGDVPDVVRHRAVDPSVPPDGDVRILDRVMRLKTDLGARGERVVYLEGNHDFHLARLAREVVRYHATRRGERVADGPPRYTDAERRGYCTWYLETYGEVVYQNNVAPYDMLERLRPDHVSFLESTPVLAVCPAAGLVVTHAGPPRMSGWRAAALKKAISRADRESLRRAPADEYYASPYHQLLNNRFRNGDYDLGDVREFLALWADGAGGLLVTGHTPHPYLVDFERRAPLAECSFRDGLGMVGEHQVVLCTSFGAFSAAQKRYLEVDLSRPHGGAAALFAQDEVRPLYAPHRCPDLRPLPGADLVLPAEESNEARARREMARTRSISSADTVADEAGPLG